MTPVYDHVVIGAGIVGSNTAWQLASKGKSVLLLEQFHLPTTRGSSHGQSRLIRSAYSQTHYASMMPQAYAIWRQIEKESNTTLIKTTKAVCITKKKQEYDDMITNLKKYSPECYENMNINTNPLTKLMNLSDDHYAVMDLSGGVIYAQKALTTVQCLFKKRGGEIKDACTVTSIKNLSDGDVIITTSNGTTIRAHSVVVCAGCWTSRLFSEEINKKLAKCTKAVAIKVFYWKIIKDCAEEISSMLDSSDHDFEVYSLASSEYPGLMKVCVHGGGVPCNPDEREKAKFDGTTESKLSEYVKKRLPFLEPTPAIVEKCMYTVTPDEDFIIDAVPTYQNVYIGSGFSGTGFKTSSAVGKLLCQLALGEKPFQDLTPFRLSRFD